MSPVSLTVIVLTLNEERHIRECLNSVRDFADELLVFDSGSSDGTVATARELSARVETRPFDNYPRQRNAALDLARGDWVFFIDADERATPALGAEIRERIASSDRPQSAKRTGPVPAGGTHEARGAFPFLHATTASSSATAAGFWVPRRNLIFGKEIRHTGWSPDYQPRLLRKGAARFDPEREVHELVIWDGETGFLVEPLIHYNYETLAQFHRKQMAYTRYEARVWLQEGRRVRLRGSVGQPLREFYRRFVTLEGWRDGGHGLLLSGLMAYYAWVRHRMLWQMAQAEAQNLARS